MSWFFLGAVLCGASFLAGLVVIILDAKGVKELDKVHYLFIQIYISIIVQQNTKLSRYREIWVEAKGRQFTNELSFLCFVLNNNVYCGEESQDTKLCITKLDGSVS